jgi:hypothetical protein
VPEEVKQMLNSGHMPVAARETIPILIAAQQNGEIAMDDPNRLAMLYFSLLQGLAISRIQQKDTPLPDADMVLRTLVVK